MPSPLAVFISSVSGPVRAPPRSSLALLTAQGKVCPQGSAADLVQLKGEFSSVYLLQLHYL